jgi:diguanylate cyclase (GGDEF)-like protein
VAKQAPAKVLVADDSATVRGVLLECLPEWGFEVVAACDGAEAWAALSDPAGPRLALLDWEMPHLSGIDLCRRVRAREGCGGPYTYVVLLTAHGREDLVAGMGAGADDYVVKPFEGSELRARLLAGRRVVDLHAELYRLQAELRQQSRTDPLTGCLNRRAALERLEAEAARARREGQPLTVAVLDVDHFKHVNDGHGHAAGDAVLRELVRRLGGALRASDSFGRLGGEEFLVLWPHAADPQAIAERIRDAVAGHPFVVGRALRVTASVGVTTTAGDEPVDVVLARADEALYEAKLAGRDRVAVRPAGARASPRGVG